MMGVKSFEQHMNEADKIRGGEGTLTFSLKTWKKQKTGFLTLAPGKCQN